METSPKKGKLIVVCGPTASGKSDLAVRIGKAVDGEVVSADSRQIYKGMNIGTGKITHREMKGIPHHMLDVASPKRRYTVQDFKKNAEHAMDKILIKNKVPILCGGTGFYIEAVVDNIVYPNVPPDPLLRKKLNAMDPSMLMTMIKKLDPTRAAMLDPSNKVRIVRAIEIASALGAVPPVKKEPRYDTLMIGITIPEADLRQKIEKRLHKRMRQGMIEEVKELHRKGLSWKRMEEIGLEYRYIARYLEGKLTKKEMFDQLSFEIWHYAKRQMTWFKREKRIEWYSPDAAALVLRRVNTFLERA